MNENELVAVMIVSWCITLCFIAWLVFRRNGQVSALEWPTIKYHKTFMKESKTTEKTQ
jgi:hypothetical protein